MLNRDLELMTLAIKHLMSYLNLYLQNFTMKRCQLMMPMKFQTKCDTVAAHLKRLMTEILEPWSFGLKNRMVQIQFMITSLDFLKEQKRNGLGFFRLIQN